MRILAVQNAKRLRDGIGRTHEASVPRDVQLIHGYALDARVWVVRADESFREVADHTNAGLHLARASKRPATAPRGGRDPDHDVASGVELRHQHCVGDALQTLPDPTRLHQTLPDLTICYPTLPDHTRPYHTLSDLAMPYDTLPDPTRPCQSLPDSTRPYNTLPDLARPCNMIRDPTRPYQALPHSTICYPTLPDPTRLNQTLPYFARPYQT